ncbi:imelysin family protein [Frigidibacter sp. ROC022]|uniref:imelysin family protein n=1 Tax=Frigidibacter sp. ROC022 TaxID=2971796 RepID=UPI00215A8031|nr:imelysin family protein [Frigidibacter sp. ROC022]MCR8724166.1 imelysin family protein [Frigidibacter sp. ROC022]
MRKFLFGLVLCLPLPALADAPGVISDVIDNHILPRIETLADTGAALDAAAQADCRADSAGLRSAYQTAFDAWTSASHLRFGPTETGNRAFALAFWPDSRGMGPKALRGMILGEDPVVNDPGAFASASVAVRGYFALDLLLYDPGFAELGTPAYRCSLIRAVSHDIADLTGAIRDEWGGSYADTMRNAGANETYRSTDEALQELYKALYTGLEFTANTRLGQPLGTFDRPRPKRAEAWRSGRSLRNVELSLQSLRDLTAHLAEDAGDDPDLASQIDYAFGRAIDSARALDDPIFAGVADPMARFRVESLQQMLFAIRNAVRGELGPALGVSEGFSINDGD